MRQPIAAGSVIKEQIQHAVGSAILPQLGRRLGTLQIGRAKHREHFGRLEPGELVDVSRVGCAFGTGAEDRAAVVVVAEPSGAAQAVSAPVIAIAAATATAFPHNSISKSPERPRPAGFSRRLGAFRTCPH